jgi:3-methyladenine DNA glycosylase/8-oxoguanine DNA glycosylase
VRGPYDPAHRFDREGVWWACATPDGDATMCLRVQDREVWTTAWGAGAEWLLERVPVLLGGGQPPPDLDLAAHPLLREVARRHPGLRLPATGLVMDSLVPAVLEQKVTGTQAHRGWRGLLHKYGRPAPGPRQDLRVPPDAATILQIPGWVWHRMDVGPKRMRTLRAAATVADRLEEAAGMEPASARRRLRAVPGIGPWTAAETVQRVTGDPDAVSVGDFHIPSLVVHFFTGRARGTDEEMLELLHPWTGYRQWIVRLIELAGVGKPKFGPRYAPQDMRRF